MRGRLIVGAFIGVTPAALAVEVSRPPTGSAGVTVTLNPGTLLAVRRIDERFQSYNVEMADHRRAILEAPFVLCFTDATTA